MSTHNICLTFNGEITKTIPELSLNTGLAAGLDRCQQTDAILLDFSKAFDKVSHQRLAAKLHHYGIRDQTLSCLKRFLADSRPRWEIIFSCSSHVRGSTWHSPRPSPNPGLHQRPALKSLLISMTFC